MIKPSQNSPEHESRTEGAEKKKLLKKFKRAMIIFFVVLFLFIIEPVSIIIYDSYNRHLDNLENQRIMKEVQELCPRYNDYILERPRILSNDERRALQLYYLTLGRTTSCCYTENYQLCCDFLNITCKVLSREKKLLVKMNETDWRLIDFEVDENTEEFYFFNFRYYEINGYWNYTRIW